jgi:hypothetical protein
MPALEVRRAKEEGEGEREAVLRVEQEDKGRHRRSSPGMARRSSLHLSAGLAATTAYPGARRPQREEHAEYWQSRCHRGGGV